MFLFMVLSGGGEIKQKQKTVKHLNMYTVQYTSQVPFSLHCKLFDERGPKSAYLG